MKKYCLIIAIAALLAGCNGGKVKISGNFAGCDSLNVYLEQMNPMRTVTIDTALTNNKGFFKFKASLPKNQPTLYNLRCKNENITLLLKPGEKVEIYSIPGMINGYTIKGSEESQLIKEVKDILGGGAARLDSIMNAYSIDALDESTRKAAGQNYVNTYYDIKKQHLQFIIDNSSSLAAVYALYQRLPNDEVLFNGDSDIVYYRMVADSVAKNYPSSPYLASLKADIARSEQSMELLNSLSEKMNNPANSPEVEMADMYGKMHKLSDLQGKVVLLDFWSIENQSNPYVNADLKALYEKYAEKGFEIYQVSVDSSKPAWVATVQAQQLPWISVCDFRGGNSSTVRNYSVTSVPANFLLDKEGNIVKKNIYGEDLDKEVARLLR